MSWAGLAVVGAGTFLLDRLRGIFPLHSCARVASGFASDFRFRRNQSQR